MPSLYGPASGQVFGFRFSKVDKRATVPLGSVQSRSPRTTGRKWLRETTARTLLGEFQVRDRAGEQDTYEIVIAEKKMLCQKRFIFPRCPYVQHAPSGRKTVKDFTFWRFFQQTTKCPPEKEDIRCTFAYIEPETRTRPLHLVMVVGLFGVLFLLLSFTVRSER
ncbi:multidrug resistance protein CDR1 [Anopheles sinensis]|uniref:Multidrug resistance protein CDR1 n=1 Tax=Anopheles sinensis TaxID=74873 RepID=A0A084WDH4_ANOSI|nr:multidrug resistance protein CDR1 [Anopheles sinensis]